MTVQPQGSGRRSALVPVVLVALLLAGSAVAYPALLQVQRELFLNGLPADPGVYPRPGTDLAAAADALRRYWELVALVVACYLAVVVVVRMSSRPAAGVVAVSAGVIGQLALLPVRPGLSIDLFSYVAHGYLGSQPYNSPYLTPAAAAANWPVGTALGAEGWMAVHPQTPYGPLWTHLETLASILESGGVVPTALLIKVVVVLASIATGLLVGRIAGHVRPGWALPAAVAWLLNPVVVVEFAAEGHNDALAIAFVSLALLAALRGRALVALPALMLAGMTKYTPLVFGMAVLVMLVRTSPSRRRLLVELAAGGALAAGIGWLLWLRWWAGASTFDGLRLSTTPYATWSPAGLLASLWQDPYALQPSLVPQIVLTAALVVIGVAAAWGRTADGWLIGCAVIALAVLAASPLYWPWYSALAIAVLVMRPSWPVLAQVAVLTIGSRIAAPWGDLAALGFLPFDEAARIDSIAGLCLPLAACALIAQGGLVARLIAGRGAARRLSAREHETADRAAGA